MNKFTFDNYVLIIVAIFIICFNYLIWSSLKPYLQEKGLITKRDNLLIKIFLLLVVLALIYTYIQTDGTFVWR